MPSLGCQQVRRFLLMGHRGRLSIDRELRVTPSCAILHLPRLSTAMPVARCRTTDSSAQEEDCSPHDPSVGNPRTSNCQGVVGLGLCRLETFNTTGMHFAARCVVGSIVSSSAPCHSQPLRPCVLVRAAMTYPMQNSVPNSLAPKPIYSERSKGCHTSSSIAMKI